jgi:hypothetical protein
MSRQFCGLTLQMHYVEKITISVICAGPEILFHQAAPCLDTFYKIDLLFKIILYYLRSSVVQLEPLRAASLITFLMWLTPV